MSGQRRLEVGRVARAHGLRGEVRVLLYNPESDILDTVDRVWLRLGNRPDMAFKIVSRRLVGKQVALCLEGIEDRTRAESLIGAQVLVPRAWLPALEEDEYYHADIVGLEVEDASGRPVGRVAAIYPVGAHDVIEVQGRDGRRRAIPMVAHYIVRVDVAAGTISVHHLEDLEAADGTGGPSGAV